MSDPKSYYTQCIHQYGEQLKAVNKQLRILSVCRLLSFLACVFIVYQFWGQIQPIAIGLFIGLAVFLFLISKYNNKRYQKHKIQKLLEINRTELRVLEKEFDFLETGQEYSNSEHDFSHDIDLFGQGGFFQYCNRTQTLEGKNKLASIFIANQTEEIDKKQSAIEELAVKTDWRQEFSAIAALVKTEVSNATTQERLQGHKLVVRGIMRILPWLFASGSVVVIGLSVLEVIPSSMLVYWLILGLIITGLYFKRIGYLANQLSAVQDSFRQYQQLIALIERTDFTSELLKQQQSILKAEGVATSEIIKQFSKRIDNLEQRNNLFVSITGNGLLLFDIYNAYRVEKWIAKHKDQVEKWFDVVSFFDAYNTLGNFSFNHPKYSYPKIEDSDSVIRAMGLGHPLIKESKLIANDITIENGQFFVITGANMAGKSTFLRTISLYIMMANTGLPVCADSSSYSPIKLITSMRTIDSLAEDASYFYAELKRLKYIVDKVKTEPYFIVLDEILKGTNSKDKAIGSKKFIEKLTMSHCTGIIATHDLSLCELALEKSQVKNYFFEAFIQQENLSFDYTLKAGKCENMNASFLLKSMGIV